METNKNLQNEKLETKQVKLNEKSNQSSQKLAFSSAMFKNSFIIKGFSFFHFDFESCYILEHDILCHTGLKCDLLIAGIQYAIPRCPGMNASKLVSGLQVLLEVDTAPVTHPITLAPDGEPLTFSADQTWAQIAPTLLDRVEPFWLGPKEAPPMTPAPEEEGDPDPNNEPPSGEPSLAE